ncbi:MAG: replicative DNA helicase [Planctomycetia bacterium]|nr:replicative DNA helicase [Planctomycetia bacterium]
MADQGGPDRLPPHNREAERSILGSILRDNNVINDVIRFIQVDHFYVDAHRTIYQAMVTLYNDRHQPVDLVTLAEILREQQQIENVGGYPYLGELWDAAPTAANILYYSRIVRDKAITRQLIRSSTEILRDAYEQATPADELLGQAERKILEIAEQGVTDQTSTLYESLNAAWDRIDTRAQQGHLAVSGVPTGYPELNELTAGMHNGELIIVAARPGVGKTSFALSLARNVAIDEQAPVFLVSLEMSRIELAERLMSAQARVPNHKMRKGHLNSDDMQRLMVAADRLRQGKMFIDDSPGQNMLRIAANARRLKLREGIRVVMIDYLQLIEPESRRDPRQEQVAQISRRLKVLARELNMPVVALAQLNRGPEDRQDHKPRLSDLRESGSLEQDADVVMMLHRPELYGEVEKEGLVDIIIAKQRNGPTDTVHLAYLKEFMSFENFTAERPFEV